MASVVRNINQELEEASSDKQPDIEVYPSQKYKDQGGVAHMVDGEGVYRGTAKYGDPDKSDDWETVEVAVPPPPSREHHEKYGIMYSHGCLEDAIDFAKSGDRIYVEPTGPGWGHDTDAENWLVIRDKDLEILAINGRAERTVVILKEGIMVDGNASLRIANLTLKYGYLYGKPGVSRDLTIEALEREGPMITVQSEDAKLFLDNCVVDMGGTQQKESNDNKPLKYHLTGKTFVHRGIVSGIFLDQAKTAVLSGCRFSGGCGGFILLKYDPYEYRKGVSAPTLTVSNCSFSNTGFKHGNEETPALATVELWRVKRDKEGEIHSNLPVRLVGNTITNNFQAPIGYRTFLSKCADDGRDFFTVTAEGKGTVSLLQCGAEASSLVVAPFKLTFEGNEIKSNGLRLDSNLWAEKDEHEGHKPKKQKRQETGFPDGNVVLAVQDIAVDMYRGDSPYYGFMGEPCKARYFPYSPSALSDDEYYW